MKGKSKKITKLFLYIHYTHIKKTSHSTGDLTLMQYSPPSWPPPSAPLPPHYFKTPLNFTVLPEKKKPVYSHKRKNWHMVKKKIIFIKCIWFAAPTKITLCPPRGPAPHFWNQNINSDLENSVNSLSPPYLVFVSTTFIYILNLWLYIWLFL